MGNELMKLDAMDSAIAKLEDVKDVQRLLAMSRGIMTAAVKMYKGVDDISGVKADRDNCYEIGLKAGEVILKAESKLGELLSSQIKPGRKKNGNIDVTILRDSGITKQESSRAQAIYKNRDMIPEVVAEAREAKDIPTKSAIFSKIKEKKQQERRGTVKAASALPEAKFNVIYADPPWEYANTGVAGSAASQYPTMSIDKLIKFGEKVKAITADNAVLFMWVTNPILEECFPVLEAWGFKYKTNCVWVKDHTKSGGMGFYVYGKHELLLIAIKGNFLPTGIKPGSVLDFKKTGHSKKPEEAYEIIEKAYPDCKYIELFARNKRKGWDSWGNQI